MDAIVEVEMSQVECTCADEIQKSELLV